MLVVGETRARQGVPQKGKPGLGDLGVHPAAERQEERSGVVVRYS